MLRLFAQSDTGLVVGHWVLSSTIITAVVTGAAVYMAAVLASVQRAKLKHVTRQIQALYSPLTALCMVSDEA